MIIGNIVKSYSTPPYPTQYWGDLNADSSGKIVKTYFNGNWIEIAGSGSSGGLTPEQEAKLNTIVTNGGGNNYLADDGTYKPISAFDNYEQYPTKADFPSPGNEHVLYLDLSDGNLYYWNGSDYSATDAGLFANYVDLGSSQTITGSKTFTGLTTVGNTRFTGYIVPSIDGSGNIGSSASSVGTIHSNTSYTNQLYPNGAAASSIGSTSTPFTTGYFTQLYTNGTLVDMTNTVVFDINNNIILRPGTKIAGTPADGGTSHEVFGINTYTDTNGEYDQLEVGSKEALFNINILQDDLRTEGHATADVYNTDGSYNRKEVFAYVSDVESVITPASVSTVGSASLQIPAGAQILMVNYNHTLLFRDEYTITSNTLTVDSSVIGTVEPTDKIEVTYFLIPA